MANRENLFQDDDVFSLDLNLQSNAYQEDINSSGQHDANNMANQYGVSDSNRSFVQKALFVFEILIVNLRLYFFLRTNRSCQTLLMTSS